MTTYVVTSSNWNDPAFWASISESGPGHVIDFSTLPANFTVRYDYSVGEIRISDGLIAPFVIGDASAGGSYDATLGGSTELEYFDYVGTDFVDTVVGHSGDNSVQGNGGVDRLIGNGGQDTLDGGDGDDRLWGGDGDDSLIGGVGNDSIRGDGGDDLFVYPGGTAHGNDTLFGGETAETAGDHVDLSQVTGPITVTYSGDEAGSFTDGVSTVTFSEIERFTLTGSSDTFDASASTRGATVEAGAGSDTLTGSSGQDSLEGGAEADSLIGGDGADTLSGGAGNDTLGDYLTDGGDDLLQGGDGDDTMVGGAGNDTLFGDDGSDTLAGGSGDDTLYGGDDIDVFLIGDDHDGETIFGGEGGADWDVLSLYNFSFATGVTVTFSADEAGTYSFNSGTATGSFSEIEQINVTDNSDLIDATLTTSGRLFYGNGGADTILGGTGSDTLEGGDSGDSLSGGDGADSLLGQAGADTLLGGEGNDSLEGGIGADSIDGGIGNDTIVFEDSFGSDTVIGGDGTDRLDFSALSGGIDMTFTGFKSGTVAQGADTIQFSDNEIYDLTNLDDTVTGGTSSLNIYTLGGDDSVIGSSVADGISLGAGNDTAEGGGGFDHIRGFEGDDLIYGGDGTDLLRGLDDNDTIFGEADSDTIQGGLGNDSLDGGAAGDSIQGEEGDDILEGGAGDDTLEGGIGADTIFGGGDNDSIDGGTGSDTLDGGTGNDTLSGGEDADFIRGGYGDDSIEGGAGDDILMGADGADVVQTIVANDFDSTAGIFQYQDATFAVNDSLGSPSGDSALVFTSDSTWDAGNYGGVQLDVPTGDLVLGETYRMSFWVRTDGPESELQVSYQSGGGGPHNFVVTSADATSEWQYVEVTATLDAIHDKIFIWGEDPNTTYAVDALRFEQVAPSSDNDTIAGGDGDDTIYGALGDDVLGGDTGADSLDGGDGADTLTGGTGNDTLTGGAGDDVYAFDDGFGGDRITDFDIGDTDGDGFYNDQLDASGLTDASGNPVNVWDVTVSDDGFGNALLSFPNGETVVLEGIAPASLSSTSQLVSAGVACFAAGTLIRTPQGERPIESLRRGDLVDTLDGGAQKVVWAGNTFLDAEKLRANPTLKPVFIPEGLFGNYAPLLVSPQHGMLVGARHGIAGEHLARARHLADAKGPVRVARGKRKIHYHHLMFQRHQIIFANGAPSESFYPGPSALRMFDPKTRRELGSLVAGLETQGAEAAYGPRARVVLKRPELLAKVKLRRALNLAVGSGRRQKPEAHRPDWDAGFSGFDRQSHQPYLH